MTSSAIIAQFKRPHGALGRLAGMAMAERPSNRKRNRWTLDLLDLADDAHVFELGCGPGYALGLAARRCPNGFVTGVDHSAVMIAMARRRLSRALRVGRANLILGGAAHLKASDATLDAVYSANVIQFLDDRPAFFRAALAALKPGGRCATTYQPRGKNPSAEKARAMAGACADEAHAAGFVDIRTETLNLKGAPAICVVAVK